MLNWIFVVVLALLLGGLYTWGFRRLCEERWQFIATIPIVKNRDGQWRGLNLTYYGFFNACACMLAVIIVYVLLGAAGTSLETINLILVVTLAPCIPAAKLMAYWVEKKAHTFSIGGAAFVGFVTTPWLMILLNDLFRSWGMARVSIMPALAAFAIAYALGEGSGRLACISFGCCYGKPIGELPAPFRRMLAPLSISFHGHTKKISYADGLQACRVVAIQAITAVLYSLAGLIAILLFLQGRSAPAYLLCVVTTQIWRFLSEFLRADFRGAGRISAYQIMSLCAAVYAFGIFAAIPSVPFQADILHGLGLIWHPGTILLCQILWIGIFLYMGRSHVTGARICFHVHKDRI